MRLSFGNPLINLCNFILTVRYVADVSEKDLVTLGFQVSKDVTNFFGEYF